MVEGTGQVTNNDKTFLLGVGESTYIEKESVHRIENKENEPLEIIEVQVGSYLGEDDIVRIEDIYGRKT